MTTEEKLNSVVQVLLRLYAEKLHSAKQVLYEAEEKQRKGLEWQFMEEKSEKEARRKRELMNVEISKIKVQNIEDDIKLLKEGGC